MHRNSICRAVARCIVVVVSAVHLSQSVFKVPLELFRVLFKRRAHAVTINRLHVVRWAQLEVVRVTAAEST